MNKLLFLLMSSCCLLSFFASSATAASWPENAVTNLQHSGAIYFDFEPGNFSVTIYKRDLPSKNAVDRTLKILLYGPDGTLFGEDTLLSKREKIEKAGTIEQMQLHADIRRAGVYMLLLTSPNREGSSYEWGFSTNAQKYMISSVAGHPKRDPDPIILHADDDEPAKPFSIFFKTPAEPFKIIASNLSRSAKTLQMLDSDGELVQALEIENGKAEGDFTANKQEVWELRLPSKQGRIVIDGVSRYWTKSKNAFPVWTTSREHYFDIGDYYWLLHPRRFSRDASLNKRGNIPVNIANSTDRPMSLNFMLENVAPSINAKVTPAKVLLQPGAEQEVQIQYDVSANAAKEDHEFYLIARDENTGKQSFSHFELRSDHENLGQNVQLPIDVQLYSSQSQFAYEPDYPRTSQLYFDKDNRPWTIDTDGLKVLLDGQWKLVMLPGGNQPTDAYPGMGHNAPEKTLGTDDEGFVYSIVKRGTTPYLLRVRSDDLNAQIVPLPGGGNYMIEVFNGGGTSSDPPAVLRFTETSQEKIARFAKLHSLELFVPTINDGSLTISNPILLSEKCIGMAAHSGMPSPSASFGDDIHVIWGEISDTANNDPGVPTYVASYNRKTKSLAKSLIAYAPPINDVHNMSSILVDTHGGKHAIIGSHGKPFQYLYSPRGSNAWPEPKKMSDQEQTYIGATFDQQGGITVFFRVWEHSDSVGNAVLAYQRMDKNEKWGPVQRFAKGPLLSYGVYYHRVTVDRTGRVYVSFEYWTTWDNYRNSIREPEPRYRLTNGLDRWVFSSLDGERWDLLRGTKELERTVKP